MKIYLAGKVTGEEEQAAERFARDQFIKHFFPKGSGKFSGQIIHWTNLRY